MLIAAGTFVGILALIFGAYYLLVMRQEEELLSRLTPKRENRRALRGIIRNEVTMSSVGSIQAALERSPTAGKLKMFLEQAGSPMNVFTFLLVSGIVAMGSYLFLFFMTGNILIGLAAAGITVWIPYLLMKRKRTKRLLKFEEFFPDAIDLVGRALRAGHALPTGLGMVADEMAAPIGPEFRTLFDEQNYGLPLPDALRNFAGRVPVLDARFFVTAVLTQRESGGNLAEVLDNLASVIRDRFKVKRQIRVISAHGRITGWVLACLPPCLAMATLLLNRQYLGTLLHDPLGHQMIYAAVSLQIIGTLIMRKITNIEY